MDFSISQFNQPAHVEPLGFGAVVTPNTMDKMRRMITDSLRDYRIRQWAEHIIDFAPDDYSKTESVYNFVVNNCRYVQDPVGLEMLKTPIVSLQQIEAGGSPAIDCDDAAILIGALLESVGIPYALRAVAFEDSNYSHVYGLAYIKDRGWVPVDFVLGKIGGEFGQEPTGRVKVLDMEV